MEFIYGVGLPGGLDFYTTRKRVEVPAEATLFAICTAASVIENTDEELFDAISDQEYFTVQLMISEARRRIAAEESSGQWAKQFTLEISVKDFFRWLTCSQTTKQNCNKP